MRRSLGALLALFLVACRGGGGASSPATPAGKATAAASVATARLVETVDVADGLKVMVWVHPISRRAGPSSGWTYVSAGLQANGSAELRFTVLRREGDRDGDFPRDILPMFAKLHDLAKDGTFLPKPGDLLVWGRGELGERKDLMAAIMVAPESIPGVDLPSPTVGLVALTEDEAHMALETTEQRVLALLGLQDRYYPHPYWLDRDRASTVTPAMREETALARIPDGFYNVGRLTAVFDRAANTIVVQLPRDGAREIVALDSKREGYVAVRADLARTADAALVWVPGREHSAIHPDGSKSQRLSAAFLLVMKDDEGGTAFRILEDGFFVTLATADWNTIISALGDGKDASIPIQTEIGTLTFRVEILAP